MFNKTILFIITLFLLFTGCNKKDDTMNIGVVLGLSGKYSSLGNAESDGIHLAFNEINYTINGKKIKLLEKNDAQDKQTDIKAIKELINNNVKLIIGNATSSMTQVSLDILKSHPDILLFSATASSNDFNNKDDNFLRSNTGTTKQTYSKMIHFIKKNNIKNIVIIGDSNNKSYLKSYTKLLPQYLKEDYLISTDLPYIDSNNNLQNILNQLKKYDNTDLILLVANSVDSAKIIQYLRVHHLNTNIICSGWANDNQFFQNIGKYGEGIYFLSSIAGNTDAHDKFTKNFVKLYGRKPDKFAKKGYVAASIIIQALQKNDNISKLKQTILTMKEFNTILGKITFNKYGDINAKVQNIFQIKNGTLKQLNE